MTNPLQAIDDAIEALTSHVYETTCLSPKEDDGSHICKISEETLGASRKALTNLKAAREALTPPNKDKDRYHYGYVAAHNYHLNKLGE